MKSKTTEILDEWERQGQEAKSKARDVLFRLLRKQKKLASVEVTYDGYGDSGQIESVTFFGRRGKVIQVSDEKLTEAVENYVYCLLPRGWENDGGAFGTVVIEPDQQKVKVKHNDRYETYETSEYED